MFTRERGAARNRSDPLATRVIPAVEPIHRAVDRVSGLQITVQRMRQHLVAQDGTAQDGDQLEEPLHDPGGLLVALRVLKD